MLKIAFLMLTTTIITQEPIWLNFLQGNEDKYSFYIHSKSPLPISSIFKKYELQTRIKTTWSNTMLAQIELLKEALKDPNNDRFIFVSGDSIPIQRFDYIYSQLFKHSLSQFFYSWNDHQDKDSRFYSEARIMPHIPTDKQFKNSQWLILNRKHAQLMVADDLIIKIISRRPNDQEHYPSTLLALHNQLNNVLNMQGTLVIWPEGGSHPYTWHNLDDTYYRNRLIEAINTGTFFARKINDSCDTKQLTNLINKYAYKA